MTEVAGEVCDGFLCHGFTTERYLREVTLPALERGRAKAGRRWTGFEIVGPSFVVTGSDDEQLDAGGRPARASRSRSTARRRRTAACSSVHGWGGLQDELNALSKQGKWVEMGELIDDEILNTFAVVGAPEEVGPELHRRYGDVVTADQLLRPVRAATPTAGARSSRT